MTMGRPLSEKLYVPWRERPLLQLKEAAVIAGVSPAKLYYLVDEGRLKFKNLEGRTLVDTESLIALIDNLPDWVSRGTGKRVKRAPADAAQQS